MKRVSGKARQELIEKRLDEAGPAYREKFEDYGYEALFRVLTIPSDPTKGRGKGKIPRYEENLNSIRFLFELGLDREYYLVAQQTVSDHFLRRGIALTNIPNEDFEE